MPDPDAGLWTVRELGRRAHLVAYGVRNVCITLLVDRENLLQQRTTLLPSALRESVKGAARRRNGTVDILRAPQGDDPRRLLVSRVDDRKIPRLDRINPAPVYIEFPVLVGHCDSFVPGCVAAAAAMTCRAVIWREF